MIKEIKFHNFKVLRDAALPLGRFTLIIGPNGSGKSTALQALREFAEGSGHDEVVTTNCVDDVNLSVIWGTPYDGYQSIASWQKGGGRSRKYLTPNGDKVGAGAIINYFNSFQSETKIYTLDPNEISRPVQLVPHVTLSSNGHGLAGVLDRLRDEHPERFRALNAELQRWFWDYDHILFEVPDAGHRSFALRTVGGGRIPAKHLSQGTLLALAILTLAYLPKPPPLVAFEEPDRGIHPRLLRDVQDALYRLSYPENYGETREPVQVIATTHSPHFLDLFKEHPEEIVIAQKNGPDATFERLADRPDIEQILDGASLGDVWFSGILGGVPVTP